MFKWWALVKTSYYGNDTEILDIMQRRYQPRPQEFDFYLYPHLYSGCKVIEVDILERGTANYLTK